MRPITGHCRGFEAKIVLGIILLDPPIINHDYVLVIVSTITSIKVGYTIENIPLIFF